MQVNVYPLIRKAVEADIPQLVNLLEALFAIEDDFVSDYQRQERGLALILANRNSRVLCVVEGPRVLGMVSGQLTISTAEGGLSLLVEDLIVDSPWRGRGLGRRLLEEIGRWGLTRGARRMQLLADRGNQRALEFYRHLSWGQSRLICLQKKDLGGPGK